jgi:hypothetical protein
MIGGYPWKIHSRNLSKQGVLGLMYPDDFKIYIHKDLQGEDYERTLLHEIIHAVLAMNGVGCHPEVLSTSLEEQIVTALEYGLHLIYTRRNQDDN